MCDKAFPRRSYLALHQQIHTGEEKPHKCTICTKAYLRPYSLKSHIRTHTGEKPFECGTCKKVYGELSILSRHKRTHLKESDRKFSCSQCTRKFSHSHHLKNHFVTHTGIYPFKCDTCHLSFGRQATLRNHKLTHKDRKLLGCSSFKLSLKHPDSLYSHKYKTRGIKQGLNLDNLIDVVPMVFVGSDVFTT